MVGAAARSTTWAGDLDKGTPQRSRMYDYGTFSFESKTEVLDRAKTFWNPDKTQFWIDAGVDLVIDRREGYYLWDMSGRRLIDMHLNGGTYSLGHRNPEVVQAITEATQYFDIGNHHFPSVARTALAQRLVESAPAAITKVAFGSGGGEAIDIAIKSARHATQRRKIVSIVKAYHGHTGLAVATGDDRFSKIFLSTALMSSSTFRSAISAPWSRRCPAMTWQPSSWRRFRRHTDSRCLHRDTSSQSKISP